MWGAKMLKAVQEAELGMGWELFAGAVAWELGPGLSVGQEVAMGLWGRSYRWGSGSGAACGAVMWQLVCPQGRAGAGGAGGHV